MHFSKWFFLLLLIGNQSQARFATDKDLSYVIEFEHLEIHIDKDGFSKMVSEVQLKILNDQGRNQVGISRLNYDSNSTELRLLEAKTINDDKETKVSSSQIQLQDVPGSPVGFDQMKEMVIVFPQVQVGSRIYYKLEEKTQEIAEEKLWSIMGEYHNRAIDNFKADITSELPLFAKVNDPDHKFSYSTTSKDGKFFMHLELLKPVRSVIQDEHLSFTDPNRTLHWLVSTREHWSNLAPNRIADIGKLIQEPLPKAFAEIKDKAAKVSDHVEQLNLLTSLLADRLRYFGDWRQRRGGYLPRSLKEIADTGYGDCKDFALVLTAMSRALGFDANMAWIRRNIHPGMDPAEYPASLQIFNHAVARVQDGNRVYWLDGTNPTSRAQGIPFDIADRNAFVLKAPDGFLDRTPARLPVDRQMTYDLTYQIHWQKNQPEETNVEGHIQLQNEAANDYFAGLYLRPQASQDYNWILFLAGSSKILDWSTTSNDLRQRIPAADFSVPFKFKLDNVLSRTSAGEGFDLPYTEDIFQLSVLNVRDRAGDVFLGAPYLAERKALIKDVKVTGEQSLNCEIQSPWLDISRKVRKSKEGVEVVDRVQSKVVKILLNELVTPTYEHFQRQIGNCFRNATLVLTRMGPLPQIPRITRQSLQKPIAH